MLSHEISWTNMSTLFFSQSMRHWVFLLAHRLFCLRMLSPNQNKLSLSLQNKRNKWLWNKKGHPKRLIGQKDTWVKWANYGPNWSFLLPKPNESHSHSQKMPKGFLPSFDLCQIKGIFDRLLKETRTCRNHTVQLPVMLPFNTCLSSFKNYH